MHFVRDVSKEKLVKAWNKGFEVGVKDADRKKITAQINTFNNWMEDVQKNDEIVITFLNNGVEIDVKNKQKGKIKKHIEIKHYGIGSKLC